MTCERGKMDDEGRLVYQATLTHPSDQIEYRVYA